MTLDRRILSWWPRWRSAGPEARRTLQALIPPPGVAVLTRLEAGVLAADDPKTWFTAGSGSTARTSLRWERTFRPGIVADLLNGLDLADCLRTASGFRELARALASENELAANMLQNALAEEYGRSAATRESPTSLTISPAPAAPPLTDVGPSGKPAWPPSEPEVKAAVPGDVAARRQRAQAEPWKMESETYLAVMGVYTPYIGEISQYQRFRMSGAEKRRYDARRTTAWNASAKAVADWRDAVLDAYAAGKFTLDDPQLDPEAKSVVVRAGEMSRRQSRQTALARANQENRITSVDEVQVGDRVYGAMHHRYGTITRKYKHSVGIDYGPGLGTLSVNVRGLQRLSQNDLEAKFEREYVPPEPAAASSAADASAPAGGRSAATSLTEPQPCDETGPWSREVESLKRTMPGRSWKGRSIP